MKKTIVQVLLIEDNPADALLLKEALRDDPLADFQVVVVEQLKEGLAELDRRKFDVLLLDLGLPDSQGLESFATAHMDFPNIPIVVLSGMANELLALQAVQSGAQDYLVKGQAGWSVGPRAIRYAIERHNAQLAMRASEARFHTIFHASPTPTVITRLSDNQIKEVNEAWSHMTGYSAAEVVGRDIEALNLWGSLEDRKKLIQMLRRHGTVHEFEFQLRRKSGEMADLLFSAELIELGGETCMVSMGLDITGRKQAEAVLRKNEAILSQAGRMTHLGAWEIEISDVEHIDANPLLWSDEIYRIFGYEPGEVNVTNDLFFSHVHPDDRQSIADAVRQALVDKQPYEIEHRIIRRDGVERIVFEHADLTLDKAGRPIRLLGSVQDITERRRAEDSLRQSEERHRQISNLMSDYVYQGKANSDGSVKTDWVSGAFERITGYTLEEVNHLPGGFSAIIMPEDLQTVLRQQPDLIKNGMLSIEYRIRCKDGEIRWLLDYMQYISDIEFGTLLLGAVQDITERKQTELALVENESKLEDAERNAHLGYYDINIITGKAIWSDETYRIFGLKPEEYDPALGNYDHYIHAEDRQKVYDLYDECTQQKKPFDLIYRIVRPDGEIRSVHSISSLRADEQGNLTRLFGTIQDITERIQAERSLWEANELYRSLYEQSADAIYILDLQGNHMASNGRAAEMLGYTHDELMKLSYKEISTEVEESGSVLESLINNEPVPAYERMFRKKDGSTIQVEPHVSLIRDFEGRPYRVQSIVRDITERKQAELEIRKRSEEMLLIYILNDAANQGESIEAITQIFARETRNMFNCQDAAIHMLSPDGKFLEMQSSTLPSALVERLEKFMGITIPRIRIPVREDGYTAWLLSKPEGHHTNDPAEIQKWIAEFAETTAIPNVLRTAIKKLIPQIQSLLNIGSIITIPLVSSGHTIGLLDMSAQGEFTADDLQRMRFLSHQMTAVILRKQAEMNVRVQLERITALNEIDRAITSSMDMHLSLDILIGKVLSELGVDAASVLLLDPVDQFLEFAAGSGFRSPAFRQPRIHLGQGGAGQVGLERKVLHFPNLAQVGSQFVRANAIKGEGFIEYFGVPLVAKGLLKGVLEIFNRTPLTSDPDWLKYLETLGGQAAIVIDNAQMFAGLQRSNQELVTAYDATIMGWSHAMDLRDKETEGHTLRVTDLTLKLAARMGIPQPETIHIRRGALLHDIGKLGIPDHILLKPDTLTDEEWTIMKQHPGYAFEMLMPIKYLRPALDIPYCHHEKWDGSGYPRGLKGEQIPLTARIFAVVDVWDALRSNRPYRSSWAVEKVLEYIREQSGKHFEPQVVESFMKMLNESPELL